MRLTDVTIRSLPSPTSSYFIHLDDQIRGFGVRVSKGGTKTFVLTYGTERRRVKIGRYPQISLAQARDMARKHLAELTLGVKPAPVRLKALIERFLTEKRQLTRPSTYASYSRHLKRHLDFDADVTTITARQLADIFDRLHHTPQERSHLIVVVKILFRYAQRLGFVDRNPMEGFKATTSPPRERVLSPIELRAVWHACPDDAFGTSVKLMALTGQRKGEIQHMTLDGELATIPSAHTKNKRTHVFPVGEMAKELLGKPREFNGWGKSKARLDNQCGVSGWTLHDLRRTYATTLAELGTAPHIIEAILNHKSGIISGVAQTYNRFRYTDEMRAAAQNFERHFTVIVAGEVQPRGAPFP